MSTPTSPRFFRLATTFTLILLSLGCGDEPIDNTRTVGEESSADAPSTIYFPMTAGNSWTYRNPDGSEWTRDVITTNNNSADSSVLIVDKNVDLVNSYEVIPKQDYLFLSFPRNTINNTVWQIILESGGDTPVWEIRRTYSTGTGWRTRKSTADILAFLHVYQTTVPWHSTVSLLRFPLEPDNNWVTAQITLSGSNPPTVEGNLPGAFSYLHTWEANVKVTAHSFYAGIVATPLEAFPDCIKIQYKPDTPEPVTTRLMPGNGGTVQFYTKNQVRELILDLENEISKELHPLLANLTPRLAMQTMWLAPGVGPVKIETPNGIAELIDYEIKPAQ